MYHLSHLLTDQKTVMTSMMELSVTGNKVDSPEDAEKSLVAEELQKNLAFLLDRVEGCSGVTEVAGRFLVHSGDLVEVDAESFSTIQKVCLFLLNDSVMIALLMPQRRGPVRFRFQTLYELDNLAVVNVKDTGSVKNAFKLLMFPDTRLFQADSPKAKRQWLVILEETKRKKIAVDKQHKESSTAVTVAARRDKTPVSAEKSDDAVATSVSDGVDDSGSLLYVDWVDELPEDLDVCIAQRDFEGAVDLVQKIHAYLDGCHRSTSFREYRLRIDHRIQHLTSVLVHELKLSPEHCARGGRRSALRAVTQLIRLGKSVQACELFLANRSATCRYGLRQLKAESNAALYVTSMSRQFFSNLLDTAREFLHAFPRHLGCFSTFVLWAKEELQYFVMVFSAQVFAVKYNLSSIVECVTEARLYCQQLSEVGVELLFIFDQLLAADINKLIQQAGDCQMDAVRHRAAEDCWRPVDYYQEDHLQKFESDMKQLGIADIHQYCYDGCKTSLTASTVQFAQSYLTLADDLLKLYTTDRHHLVTSAFTDILSAHISSMHRALPALDVAEMKVVGHNAQFINRSLLPAIKAKYTRATGLALSNCDDIYTALDALENAGK